MWSVPVHGTVLIPWFSYSFNRIGKIPEFSYLWDSLQYGSNRERANLLGHLSKTDHLPVFGWPSEQD